MLATFYRHLDCVEEWLVAFVLRHPRLMRLVYSASTVNEGLMHAAMDDDLARARASSSPMGQMPTRGMRMGTPRCTSPATRFPACCWSMVPTRTCRMKYCARKGQPEVALWLAEREHARRA